MKSSLLTVVFLLSAVCMAMAGTGAAPEAAILAGPGFRIISPDHPATWQVGFNDKVSQRLKWSDTEGKLMLDVTYSRFPYNYDTPPSDFVTYTLSFPGVLRDGGGNLYVMNSHHQKIILGSITHGPLGMEVSLGKGVDLDVHRKEGKLDAMLLGARNAR
jgi:hypothetical protein